jgi:hypothetical protein
VEALIVRIAQENFSWGYDRIAGTAANLGHHVSDQTIGNILSDTVSPRRQGAAKLHPGRASFPHTWQSLLAQIFFTVLENVSEAYSDTTVALHEYLTKRGPKTGATD